MPLLSKYLPDFTQELMQLLITQEEDELAMQNPSLTTLQRCACGDYFCAGFYTAPKPNGPYGPGHRNVVLNPATGMIILDVVHESIRFVEVLNRDDVKEKVDRLFGPTG